MTFQDIKTPINGVIIRPLKVNIDMRGNFIEIIKEDWKILDKMAQVSVSTTHPGIIKAFHMHNMQDEIWHILEGKALIVLYDMRSDSKTKDKIFERIIGNKISQEIIFIPKGVAHGYQVLGNKPIKMLYVASKSYNSKNPDEIRIPYNDPTISFDWKIKDK